MTDDLIKYKMDNSILIIKCVRDNGSECKNLKKLEELFFVQPHLRKALDVFMRFECVYVCAKQNKLTNILLFNCFAKLVNFACY